MRIIQLALAGLAFGMGLIAPAQAEVAETSDNGFVIVLSVDAAASKTEVWRELVVPARWWSAQHTFSGDAANLYIDAQATGCFCEKLPKAPDAPVDQRMGSVEHMHVVHADPQRGVLRMVGGLGPLQGEAVIGTLTVSLKPAAGGTRIEWEYVVGGHMRSKADTIAPLVDIVLAEQMERLGDRVSTAAGAAPAP